MRNIFTITLIIFALSTNYSQNKNGIIYDYKKTQLTFSTGTNSFFEAGYLKRLTKNIAIGGSISHQKYTYTFYGSEDVLTYQGNNGSGPYNSSGVYVGYAGYEYDGYLFYTGNGRYDAFGNDLGFDLGYVYDNRYGYITRGPFTRISFMIDSKFNFLVKKRIQPVAMFSLAFSTGYYNLYVRHSYGLDFHSKNDLFVVTPLFNFLGQTNSFGLKLTIKK